MTLSLLNEIKIEIRSLLISSKNGLTEDELCHDYSLFNSQRLLPYDIFGYSTITDFLNSLTDILYRSSDGYIYPIVDQTTEHIFKFVQQQRTKKKTINTKQTSFVYYQQEYNYVRQEKVSKMTKIQNFITESNRHRRQHNPYQYAEQYGNRYGLYGPGGQGWVNNYHNRYPNQNYAWNTNSNWNQGHRRPEWYYNSAKIIQPSLISLIFLTFSLVFSF
ncbi:unnamed protein product [Rotaria sp. Silwood1]|nr:unnamed protein product [Rotaria sp. Silwood1]CAF1606651.1 unnamed protein product [Rotaria sp. Silwood1]CAF4919047.1 unnamed protein product [Rotaria sp. Silwood1]